MDSKTKIVSFGMDIDKTKYIPPQQIEFKPCSEIFPEWVNCDRTLKIWHSKIKGYDIWSDGWSGILSLQIPSIEILPINERGKVMGIINGIDIDYIPNLSSFYRARIGIHLKDKILSLIRNREQEILSYGGRTAIDELAFRLGLQSFSLSNIEFNINI